MRVVLVLLVLLLPAAAAAAPAAELWERWTAHDPTSQRRIDHAAFAELLDRRLTAFTDGTTRFDYAAVTDKDRALLDTYIENLAALPISRYNRDEQMAYWINLYNALTLQVVLDHYPVDSIRDIDISPGFFTSGPWGAKLVEVEGHPLSLDDIEHRILRPIWRDPRIHYAVNCASICCPNLRPQPYTGDMIDQQLDYAARDFINNWRGVRIDNGEVTASRIYEWYTEDFGGNTQGVIQHLLAYADIDLAQRLQSIATIHHYTYNWSLNDIPK